MKKILFETHHLYYLPNFLPIIDSLRLRGGYEIFVSMPQYMQERERDLFYNAANDIGLELIKTELEEDRIENIKSKNFDVIIVGMGPSGLVLGGLLANYGISVGIFEKKESTVTEPRAVSIDDESLRILQSFSLHKAVLKNVSQNYGSYYYDAKGKLFLKVEPNSRENGFYKRNAFDQPMLERTLRKHLEKQKNIKIFF